MIYAHQLPLLIASNETMLANASLALHGHGFGDEEFGASHDGGVFNALVTISRVLLLNVGEEEIADEFGGVFEDTELTVWVQEDSNGFKYARATFSSEDLRLAAEFESALQRYDADREGEVHIG